MASAWYALWGLCVLLGGEAPEQEAAGAGYAWNPGAVELRLLTASPTGTPQRLFDGNDVKYILELEDASGRLTALFRPHHQGDDLKHRADVAAYRLAELTGIGHVPPAVIRRFPIDQLGRMGPATLERLHVQDGIVEGSLQRFISGAKSLRPPNGNAEWVKSWMKVLRRKERCKDHLVAEAVVFSKLVILDYLQQNRDRFSGGNIIRDPAGMLWFIDNAASFRRDSRMTERRLRQLRWVDKHVYDTTSRLTRERVMGALSPLLGEERTSGVWGRIETVQRTLGDLVAVHSEDNAFL